MLAHAESTKAAELKSIWFCHDNTCFILTLRLVFMMGKPRSEKEQRIVDEEHQLFGDIVQGDFIEDYKNLTLKAIMGLKWVSLYCKQAAWAIKVRVNKGHADTLQWHISTHLDHKHKPHTSDQKKQN